MAYDPDNHVVHADTGFYIDKRTGQPAGLPPLPIERVHHDTEYPKWVVPHPGHVSQHPDHGYVMTPQWQHEVNRVNGEVKVLVNNEEEEARALAAPAEPISSEQEEEVREHAAPPDENTRGENAADTGE